MALEIICEPTLRLLKNIKRKSEKSGKNEARDHGLEITTTTTLFFLCKQ